MTLIEHVYDNRNDENAIEDDEELSGCSLQFAPSLPCKLCAADIGREAANSPADWSPWQSGS